ncbi:MAG: Zn-ribbon domain-containing OB-fold protein [Candidatus Hatepunaea meridiana]|nr:Zn-ribbon domain-containing OB-fold protein [Candidatus Hatepunaea meridiana]
MKIRSPRYHRETPQRYRLEAAKTESGKVFFPPRAYYPGGEKAEPFRMSDKGKVLTYTVIHTPAAEYSDLAPFALGIIELDGGGRITSQIVDVDPSKVKIGMRVKVEFRRIRTEGDEGLLCYGYKVVPE